MLTIHPQTHRYSEFANKFDKMKQRIVRPAVEWHMTYRLAVRLLLVAIFVVVVFCILSMNTPTTNVDEDENDQTTLMVITVIPPERNPSDSMIELKR